MPGSCIMPLRSAASTCQQFELRRGPPIVSSRAQGESLPSDFLKSLSGQEPGSYLGERSRDETIFGVLMDIAIFKIAEFALIFGAGLAFFGYQIWITRKALREDRSRETRHPEGQ
jgi:hypothetical protein